MTVLPFPDYRPDVSDTNAQYTKSVLNVFPRGDGYGPVKSLNAFTSALAAQCRGAFFARKSDGSIKVFAGTSTKLYVLDNSTLTWSDASSGGGSYTALSSGTNWSFAQFGNKAIACQANADVQVFNIDSDTQFSALGGTPPRAAYITTVNRFLVLSGLTSNPNRVHWSGLNAITTWTSGTTYSDYQDLPDGGNVTGVVGGEFGIIIQESNIRRMVFSPGSDIVFQIDRLAKDLGSPFPYSIVDASGTAYFNSNKGFYRVTGNGEMLPIGKEKVDRTFLAEYDSTRINLVQGAADPESNRIYFTYREAGVSSENFSKALVYDYILDRWSPIDMDGEYLTSLGKPGFTLESLNTIGSINVTGTANNGSGLIRLAVTSTSGWSTGQIKDVASVGGTTEANGTWTITVIDATHIDLQGSTFTNAWTSGGYVAGSLDALPLSLDDYSAATKAELAMINTSHILGYFSGANLEASLETSEQTGISKRLFVRGLYPLTDAATAYCSVARRENFYATPSYTDETLINAQGFSPQRASTRHARAKLRIPSATTWTYASGIEPDYGEEGRR